MKYLENEQKLHALTTSDVLTNYRISKEDGKVRMSIFLEKISSIMVTYEKRPFYIFLAIISIISGSFFINHRHAPEFAVILIMIGVLFIISFFLSRKHIVKIYSDGGQSMELIIGSASSDTVADYIAKVESAKLERINSLFSYTPPPAPVKTLNVTKEIE